MDCKNYPHRVHIVKKPWQWEECGKACSTLIDFYVHVCVPLCGHAHMSTGALRGQKRALYSLELEL